MQSGVLADGSGVRHRLQGREAEGAGMEAVVTVKSLGLG